MSSTQTPIDTTADSLALAGYAAQELPLGPLGSRGIVITGYVPAAAPLLAAIRANTGGTLSGPYQTVSHCELLAWVEHTGPEVVSVATTVAQSFMGSLEELLAVAPGIAPPKRPGSVQSKNPTYRRCPVSAVRVQSPILWLLAIRDVDTELPSRAVAAALVLRSYMSDRATCWPVIATIAWGMRASDRTVQRALRELEASGWLLRNSRGHHLGSKYSAALPEDAQLLARLREHLASRKDAAALIGHLPISGIEVTPVTPLHGPEVTPVSPLNPSGVTSVSSEVTRVSPKDPMKIYNPPPSPPAATGSAEMGGRDRPMTPPAGSSATDSSPDDHRRPEHISDDQWEQWKDDPLKPAGCTTYQWACFRRAIEAIAPEIGAEAHELVLGHHWQNFKKRHELVILMRHCADIDPDATRDAVVRRRYGQLPYAGADNIPAAMLVRLRTLAADLNRSQAASVWNQRAQLAPYVEDHLSRLFARHDEYITAS